jgi:hypothetical protein
MTEAELSEMERLYREWVSPDHETQSGVGVMLKSSLLTHAPALIAAARAVEGLPKTADGVPIIIGETKVVLVDDLADFISEPLLVFCITKGVECKDTYVMTRGASAWRISRVYSSKAAALAAKEGGR